MDSSPAATITRTASTQTYFTIRFLVDRSRVEDAYRAYAYFRWLDDLLDAPDPPGPRADAHRARVRLLERQQWLLEVCLHGEAPHDMTPHESMLVELTRHPDTEYGGLESYLRNMMRVMAFDVGRRGRLISAAELDEYTRWLAVAVSDAMHHFIGHGNKPADDEARYRAVSGAHILHMLRDTYEDQRAGYCNVPREVLEAASIEPYDTDSEAYRSWVAERVTLARGHLDAGRSYFARLECRRHRLAGLAYIGRFDWLTDTIAKDGFRLRRRYDDARGYRTLLRMGALTVAGMASFGARRMIEPATVGPAARHRP
jgi:phytoene/squalene synthetase